MAYREDARPEPSPLELAIEPFLRTDEELLWVDRAHAGIVFRGADAILIPFSLFWGGFALLWEMAAIGMGAPLFACFGMPFVLVGLYLIFGRFLWDMVQRKQTIYAITKHRLIVVQRRRLISLNLARLGDMTVTERADGSGRITIGKAPLGFHTNGAKSIVLEIADDVRHVYQTILDAQAAIAEKVREGKIRARVEVESQEQDHVEVEEEEVPATSETDR